MVVLKYRRLIKNGDELSTLGYGCMRLPMQGISVNENLAIEQMYYAYENGVNYYDTAYIYHGGKSEVILGKFIKKYNIRKEIFIADKLPTFIIRKKEQINEYFERQLKRLDTDYIDYYLMHMLDSYHSWKTLKDYGIIKFLEKKKREKKIRYIGFSFHGRAEEFIKILEDYPWDFCQIQYNYLDEFYQAGKKGLDRAYELGIGVVIMEPLRGGNLANKAPKKVLEKFNKYDKNKSIASWSFKWLYNHKEISVVLSGMNEIQHIKENIQVANSSNINCMNNKELKLIEDVKKIYHKLTKVPCTSCKYCMPCPVGVDIPAVFADYNSKYFFGGFQVRQQYITRVLGGTGYEKSGANLCINCGKCKNHCPQGIDVPVKLKEAHKDLDNVVLRYGLKLAYKYIKRKEIKK